MEMFVFLTFWSTNPLTVLCLTVSELESKATFLSGNFAVDAKCNYNVILVINGLFWYM